MAIDEAEPPDWVRAHVSPDQLKLNRGLLWMLVIYKCRGFDQSRYSVAQRLYIHTLGKEHKRANPSIRSLMADLECSENTAIEAVKDIETRGFVIVRRHGNGRNLYLLSWPLEDTTRPDGDVPVLCGEPTAKGGTCTRRAGRGTKTPGVGPCVDHGGEPSNPDRIPQPLRYGEGDDTALIPQPLRYEPRADTSTTEVPHLNHCGTTPQPLRNDTSTVEVEYVESALGSTSKSSKPSGLLAVGEPSRRNARATPAPPAQPKDHYFTARGIISGITRYREADGWVRAKHLIPMAQKALAVGFGRAAIARYAEMVTEEGTFKAEHHIPEFRAALARLGRDVERGDACMTHGQPECADCPVPDDFVDRPWSAQDQTDFEAALDHLGVTAADLDPARSV